MLRKPISYKLPGLWEFTLRPYPVLFNMENLLTGVDNIRYDVFLSPGLHKATTQLVICLLARYGECETLLKVETSHWVKARSRFKRFCRDVMTDAIDKSKSKNKQLAEIDMLAQIAITKMSLETIRIQFERLMQRIRIGIREQGLSHNQDETPLQLNKKLSAVQQNKNAIILQTDRELFQYFVEVQKEGLHNMRISTYGAKAFTHYEVFSNPIRNKECLHDKALMIDNYVLLSSRSDDTHNYRTVLQQLKLLFKMCGLQYGAGEHHTAKRKDFMNEQEEDQEISSFLKQIDNINVLFDWFQSEQRCRIVKKDKKRKEEYISLNKQTKKQAKLLNFLYRNFKRTGLIDKIVAAYFIHHVYEQYCPPLAPQQVLEFIVNPKVRKAVIAQLNRMKEFYGQFSLAPLWEVVNDVKKIKTYHKKKYLLRFLHDFTRYHRDFENFILLNEILEQINLVNDKKTIRLSRANNTLYDFLLKHEQKKQKTPIKNHVIIKADVRGSTDLTFQMKQKGLNPASYFSLNFFDPISDILTEYGAIKIFIEGDAMILSILGREGTRGRWHTVACACGLAKNMLAIIHQTNKKSHQHGLPVFELGIGISFANNVPTFLFDGDHRIMISSAINLADRLSGCSKMVRRRLEPQKKPFNLYVFQPLPDPSEAEAQRATVDDLSLRYNVNGIELNIPGFKKLSQEIDLKELQCSMPELQEESFKVYTGIYPTLSGQYQRLVIREERIPEVQPDSLEIIRMTSRYYYEVCTHPVLHKHVAKLVK
ncbi:hypothetical protein QUF75_08645 [Desulfococcaceae bacterium HSG7]|nr:hypothetical protein [Desulfococcaceae bacterium HSG7]